MAPDSLAPLGAAAGRPDSVVVPVAVQSSGRAGAVSVRDVDVVAYAADPVKRRLDFILETWQRARRGDETLVITGTDRVSEAPGVRFTGRLPPDEFRALLRRARVFVAASRREDFGIAQLEALADGAMLVTTPAPGPYPALALARELDSAAGGRGPRTRAAGGAGRPRAGVRRPGGGAGGALQPGGGDDNPEPTRIAAFAGRMGRVIAPGAIPSPSSNGFSIGPFFFHAYGIAYVFAVAAAIYISRRRWGRVGGDPELCYEIAMWAFPAGLIGGRIYFDITTPSQIPDHWWGIFAIWQGGLGIWGGIAGGVGVGLWVAHRRLGRADLLRFMDVAAPGLLVAQAIGRIGNYFNQELFGAPSSLPWALKISRAHRPAGYLNVPDVRADVPLRAPLEPAARRVPGVAGVAAQDPRAGAVRVVCGGLLGLSHLRGDPADRLLQPHPRAAPELLRRPGPVCDRAAVVRGVAARMA